MAEIVLSGDSQSGLMLDKSGKRKHSELKNLGFDESGHTGFQKELTPEQLEAIRTVENKEDVKNKVTELSANSTDSQYPTAKAVYEAVHSNGNFELIESATITEDVVQITPTINGQYKKLYWRFKIPTNNADGASTEKARFYFFHDSNTNLVDSRLIIQNGNFIENFKQNWQAHLYTEFVGNYARSEILYGDTSIDSAYPIAFNSGSQNIVVLPWRNIKKPYLDYVTVTMVSTNGGRVFPSGTTYEVWGVKAY